MKYYSTLIITLLTSYSLQAQVSGSKADTSHKSTFTTVESIPEFPGGMSAFGNYLSKNIQYPDVARLIGINGKLSLSFVVDKDGKIVDVTPKNCIGAGCEAEAVRLLETSPVWKPGMQNGKPVKVMFSVPLNFDAQKAIVKMKDLRTSGYGFIFNIKGKLYLMDEAEAILGDSFMSDRVDIAEPFYNYNKEQKFEMPDKKEVYLVIIKSTKSS